jgi:WD40 repeat protein
VERGANGEGYNFRMNRYFLPVLCFVFLFAGCANVAPTAEPAQVVVVEEERGRETAVAIDSVEDVLPTDTPAPSATPPHTPSPTVTSIETATMTLTPVPTLSIRVNAGTAVPQSNQPITTDNVNQLTELARWGRGVINDIALSGNGRWLAVGTATGVYIHDTEDLKTSKHLKTAYPVKSVAISPDGSVVATNGINDHVQVWDVDQEKLLYDKSIKSNVFDLKFSPSGEQIILSSHEGVKILLSTDGSIIKTYPDALDAEFSLDNTKLAAWNRDLLSLYTWPDGELLRQTEPASFFIKEHGEVVSEIGDAQFLLEDELLMSALPIHSGYGIPTGHILIQDASDGHVVLTGYGNSRLSEPTKYVCNEPVFYWHPPASPAPWQMELTSDGQIAAFVFYDDGYSDDVQHYTSVRFYQMETERFLYDVEEGIIDIAIAPDEETWFAGLQDGRLQIRSLSDGSVLDSVADYDAPALKTAVSPDNQWVAVEYMDAVQIYHAADGTVAYRYPAHRMAFSPDGQTFALGYDDGRIEIRSLPDSTLLKTIFGHSEAVTAVTFLPSGELVSAGLDCKLQFWQPQDGSPSKTLENYIVEGEVTGEMVPVRVWDLAISQDGEFLVGDFAWSIGIWNSETGALLNTPDTENYPTNVALFENNVAIAGSPLLVGQIESDGQISETWTGEHSINAVEFSPDGEIVVTGMSRHEGALKIFLADNGEFLHEIIPVTDGIMGIAFAPNGRYFISTTIDGVTRLWGVP